MYITDHPVARPSRPSRPVGRILDWIMRANTARIARNSVANPDQKQPADTDLSRAEADAAFRRRFADRRYHPRRYL